MMQTEDHGHLHSYKLPLTKLFLIHIMETAQKDTFVLKEPQKKHQLTLQQLVVAATRVLLGITAHQELLLKLHVHQALGMMKLYKALAKLVLQETTVPALQ